MSKLDDIRNRWTNDDYKTCHANAEEDVAYLLSKLERAEKALQKVTDRTQILASHCAYVQDRYGSMSVTEMFEKSQEVYEISKELLEQLHKD